MGSVPHAAPPFPAKGSNVSAGFVPKGERAIFRINFSSYRKQHRKKTCLMLLTVQNEERQASGINCVTLSP